jgi:hypothetical protein
MLASCPCLADFAQPRQSGIEALDCCARIGRGRQRHGSLLLKAANMGGSHSCELALTLECGGVEGRLTLRGT